MKTETEVNKIEPIQHLFALVLIISGYVVGYISYKMLTITGGDGVFGWIISASFVPLFMFIAKQVYD